MGFLSSLTGSKKTEVPASGFYSQPQSYQNLYNTVSNNLNAGIGGVNASMFTPLAKTADETAGLEAIRQGFAPTQESLNQDISMFMNPYQSNVIDPVQRQAQSDFSILKQNASQAGQFGSNRQNLGANDIEQTRLNTIGNLNRQGYNDALGAVLNNLIPQRQSDAAGLLGIGQFDRNLNQQSQQAPLQALQAQQGLLSGIPTQFGDFGNQAQTIKTGGGLGGLLNTAGQVASIASMFSDERLKERIIHIGEENGHKIYEFSYKGSPYRWVGVMAQDILETHPEAVHEVEGFYAVDYEKIGVSMRAA